MTACVPSQDPLSTPVIATMPVGDVPTPTPFTIGTSESHPLRQSVAMVRDEGSETISGTAVILSSDGFLITTNSALGKDPIVQLPDGRTLEPIRIASGPEGLQLLKVAANDLTPIHLAAQPPAPGETVIAAGFEPTAGSFGEMTGQIEWHGSGESRPADTLGTGIPFLEGFQGGALADRQGAVLGLLVPDEADAGRRTVAAIPCARVASWITEWWSQTQELVAESGTWPRLTTPDDLRLAYPSDWKIASSGGKAGAYRAEIVPSDLDVPLRLSLAINSASDEDPMTFAEREFGDQNSAQIWGPVAYGGIKGVRVQVAQEGARVDAVYLFTGQRQIALSLTAGYSVRDTGDQATRAMAVLEAVLDSIRLDPATPEPASSQY